MNFPFSRTFSAGTHQLGVTDLNVLCDTSQGIINFVLPNINTLMSFLQKQGYSSGANGIFTINITDISGNANTNNIIISPNPEDGIAGGVSTVIINKDNGNVLMKPVSDNLWSALVTYAPTTGAAIATNSIDFFLSADGSTFTSSLGTGGSIVDLGGGSYELTIDTIKKVKTAEILAYVIGDNGKRESVGSDNGLSAFAINDEPYVIEYQSLNNNNSINVSS